MFGLVQGEPGEEDKVVAVEDLRFAVESFYEDVFKSFDVDYLSGIFRRGFVVYPNGERSRC